jgi:hypothetical protein
VIIPNGVKAGSGSCRAIVGVNSADPVDSFLRAAQAVLNVYSATFSLKKFWNKTHSMSG